MKKRVLIAAGLAAALIGGGALAVAQVQQGGAPGPRMHRGGPGGPGGPGFGGLRDFGLRGIELTDAQRDQVKTIVDSHREEMRAVGEKLREAHRGFAEATQAETLDEAAVRAKSATVANAMADEAILRAKVRSEVVAILTAEQQEQLKQRQQERGTRRKQGAQR